MTEFHQLTDEEFCALCFPRATLATAIKTCLIVICILQLLNEKHSLYNSLYTCRTFAMIGFAELKTKC